MSVWVRDPKRRRLVRVEPKPKLKLELEEKPKPELKMEQERPLNEISIFLGLPCLHVVIYLT